ncbi:alpha-ketoglutarate-dependent dioxygenase AlkB [Candidatus Poriferisocius sp.]|uniref:alpha-ketoglutarate-dependent dioxygenase AlkB n=1 Tax=Candidatus Poriferisocius sp. TaxID=3101276 RepID=UPI003B011AC3
MSDALVSPRPCDGIAFVLGSGDLQVMGGTCQHRFEHAVPMLSRPTAPRLSLTFRHDD